MNPIDDLKKLANDLEILKKAEDVKYVELHKADSEVDLEKFADVRGWDSAADMYKELGLRSEDLMGRYFEILESDGDNRLIDEADLPSGLKPGRVKPIFVYAGRRVYDEEAAGLLTFGKEKAFVEAEAYEKIST